MCATKTKPSDHTEEYIHTGTGLWVKKSIVDKTQSILNAVLRQEAKATFKLSSTFGPMYLPDITVMGDCTLTVVSDKGVCDLPNATLRAAIMMWRIPFKAFCKSVMTSTAKTTCVNLIAPTCDVKRTFAGFGNIVIDPRYKISELGLQWIKGSLEWAHRRKCMMAASGKWREIKVFVSFDPTKPLCSVQDISCSPCIFGHVL